jgi:putative DNA primase/helicase
MKDAAVIDLITGASPPAGEYFGTVEVIRGSDVLPIPIDWLWKGWLSAGKFHILGGSPGTGKTTISLALAATVTRGGKWPDGSQSPIGNVAIWSGEDDRADTLVPRLIALGANMDRIFFISSVMEGAERRPFDPALDMKLLERRLAEIKDVRLLIIDSIVSAVAGDSHKNAETRRGLQPLVDLAISMQCAVLGLTHFSKGTIGREPLERITGSLAFGALARIVIVAAKHQEEGDDGHVTRLLVRVKSNIGPDDGGFEYDFSHQNLSNYPAIETLSITWGKAVDGGARDLLETADADGSEDTPASVAIWLHDLLVQETRLDQRDIVKTGLTQGFRIRTIQRAAKKLKIIKERSGVGKEHKCYWKLPILWAPAESGRQHNVMNGTHVTNSHHKKSDVSDISDVSDVSENDKSVEF